MITKVCLGRGLIFARIVIYNRLVTMEMKWHVMMELNRYHSSYTKKHDVFELAIMMQGMFRRIKRRRYTTYEHDMRYRAYSRTQ